MEEYYADNNGIKVQEQVKQWWSNNKRNLGWIDVLSMILPVLDPSKMYPHADQTDTTVGNQLHYSSVTPVQGHTLSTDILNEYGSFKGVTLTNIEGLIGIEVKGYTKDNYMVKTTTSGVQGAYKQCK